MIRAAISAVKEETAAPLTSEVEGQRRQVEENARAIEGNKQAIEEVQSQLRVKVTEHEVMANKLALVTRENDELRRVHTSSLDMSEEYVGRGGGSGGAV